MPALCSLAKLPFCPFCGNLPWIQKHYLTNEYSLCCSASVNQALHCDVKPTTLRFKTLTAAKKAWNTRFMPTLYPTENFNAAAISDMKDKNIFGAAISQARKTLGITQKELAMRSGLSKDHICRLENGIKLPSMRSIAKIEKTLGAKLRVEFVQSANCNDI